MGWGRAVKWLAAVHLPCALSPPLPPPSLLSAAQTRWNNANIMQTTEIKEQLKTVIQGLQGAIGACVPLFSFALRGRHGFCVSKRFYKTPHKGVLGRQGKRKRNCGYKIARAAAVGCGCANMGSRKTRAEEGV